MGGGDFSTEAYEQLRKAYSDEQQRQVDDELKGTQIMGQDYGLETVPVDSPWADKIEKWEYPSGRGQHMDEKQSPDEILQIMRDSAQERLDAAKEAEDEAAEEEDLDSVAEAEETDEDESDEVDIAEMSDEEFDSHIDAIIDGDDEEDEDEDDSDEDESDEDDDESDTEDEEETEEDDLVLIPADDLAAQIAELRAELEGMQFVSDSEEEPESDESD